MKRLLLALALIFIALVGLGIARLAMRLGMLQEPRPAAAEFRLAAVNGRPTGPRACVDGLSDGRLVLGRNGRWWLGEKICEPEGARAIWIGDYVWSGDTLTLYGLGGRPGERPMARVVRRGDTLDLANTNIGSIHTYRYVRIRGRR